MLTRVFHLCLFACWTIFVVFCICIFDYLCFFYEFLHSHQSLSEFRMFSKLMIAFKMWNNLFLHECGKMLKSGIFSRLCCFGFVWNSFELSSLWSLLEFGMYKETLMSWFTFSQSEKSLFEFKNLSLFIFVDRHFPLFEFCAFWILFELNSGF